MTACGGGGGGGGGGNNSGGTGAASIFITDAESDLYEKILVTVNAIELIGDGGHVNIFSGNETIDLKQLEDFSDLFVHAEEVPVGTFSKIRMLISAIKLIEEDGPPQTSTRRRTASSTCSRASTSRFARTSTS